MRRRVRWEAGTGRLTAWRLPGEEKIYPSNPEHVKPLLKPSLQGGAWLIVGGFREDLREAARSRLCRHRGLREAAVNCKGGLPLLLLLS